MFHKSSTSSCRSSISSSSISSCRSSYSTGTASIIVHQPTVKTPPRTTSLHFRRILLESNSSLLSLFEDEFEDIDLDDTSTISSCSSSSSSIKTASSSEEDLAIITAAIQLSTLRGESVSSLSSGNTSIIRQKSINNQNTINRSSMPPMSLFRWNSSCSKRSSGSSDSGSIKSKISSSSTQIKKQDQLQYELIFRNTQVKDTLEPMILPFDSISNISRTQFAYIRY